MKRSILVLILLSIAISACWAEDWLTIYNDDLSLVRSQFDVELEKGSQAYNYDQITSRIEPASVIVTPLKDPIVVAEQNYEYDLANTAQIMLKYIDREVAIITKDQSNYVGMMRFFDGQSIGLVENSTKKLLMISNSEVQVIRLAELPPNFYTKPTLHWNLIAPKKAKYPLQMTYLTGGFSWNVTYNTIWDGKKLIFNSWVTIGNTSGKGFENVNLKLIAGEVNKIRQDYYSGRGGMAKSMMMDNMSDAAAPEFTEKAFHDFHMYTLDQKVSFANNQTKQIQLFPTKDVKAEGRYEYYLFGDAVQSIITFKNTADQGMGIPLPKGVIKVYKMDSDNNLEFIGEDQIDHTGRNETVRINTGKAFDLVGKSMVTNQRTVSQRVSERTVQVTMRNNSLENKSIGVLYQLNANTKIISSEKPYDTDQNRKVTFVVDIQPNKEFVFSFVERTEY